ncbi:hypothetical protein F25303_3505 [Fusarium sp. NRRL 25303]|nr:hypothetical protein F25303_3505 [Fusarium sp. NRRL 25303]
MNYRLLKTQVHKLQDGSPGNDTESILEKLLSLEGRRCPNSLQNALLQKSLFYMEPGFWLNDINNAAMDDAKSDIEGSETSEISETEFLQQNDGDSDSDSVDEDYDDDYLYLWHLVEGFEELEHRWKLFSSTALRYAVLWGDYIRQPYLEIMNAQAEAYFPEALYLYSHLVPQLPIDDNQDLNASSEESGYDAKSVNQESPGVCSLDNGLGQ